MPQHDLILDNASGAAFRADVNNALAALGSYMKGPSAPPAPLAGMIWVDDDTPSATIWTVKQYDGADWIELGRLDITANIYIPSEGVIAWADVASAATVDLGAQASRNVRITGTTTIAAFGTAASGVKRQLRFAAALTLTHNATSLILPGGANITTAAGDTATAVSLGFGNWIVTEFQPAGGYGWQLCEPPRTVSAVAQADFLLPTRFRRFRLTAQNIRPDASGRSLGLRFSTDSGATFISGTSYVYNGLYVAAGVASPFTQGGAGVGYLTIDLGAGGNLQSEAVAEVFPGNATQAASFRVSVHGNGGTNWYVGNLGAACSVPGAANAIRVLTTTGNAAGTAAGTFSGVLILEGMV